MNIRLREGEYQYSLAKVIASFHFEPYFPDVRDIIRRLYGEDKATDLQFVRKIQTILKKMEKSDIIRILPKKKPWELQRYALSSFSFQDSDKNMVSFATDEQIAQMQTLIGSIGAEQEMSRVNYVRLVALILFAAGSYSVALWSLFQSVINSFVFVPALVVSIVSSLMLGKAISRE